MLSLRAQMRSNGRGYNRPVVEAFVDETIVGLFNHDELAGTRPVGWAGEAVDWPPYAKHLVTVAADRLFEVLEVEGVSG